MTEQMVTISVVRGANHRAVEVVSDNGEAVRRTQLTGDVRVEPDKMKFEELDDILQCLRALDTEAFRAWSKQGTGQGESVHGSASTQIVMTEEMATQLRLFSLRYRGPKVTESLTLHSAAESPQA